MIKTAVLVGSILLIFAVIPARYLTSACNEPGGHVCMGMDTWRLPQILRMFCASILANEEETQEEHFANWGSFTSEDAYSYDGRLVAHQRVEKEGHDTTRMVFIDIEDTASSQVIYSFPAERAWDFWGICWESDSYNIWIQSGDTGVTCFEYVNGEWKENHELERPADVISKYDD